jgi:hypothetical protein
MPLTFLCTAFPLQILCMPREASSMLQLFVLPRYHARQDKKQHHWTLTYHPLDHGLHTSTYRRFAIVSHGNSLFGDG